MSHWILVISQANKEKLAAQNLTNQGYKYYLPVFREKIVKGEYIQEVTKVLFPRYMFVNIHQQWASITGTYGVSAILMDGVSPKIIPQKIIDQIKEREDINGFIVLDTEKQIQGGDSVKISEGPFKDIIGIYQGMTSDERAVVLFKLLGSNRKVKVNPQILTAV